MDRSLSLLLSPSSALRVRRSDSEADRANSGRSGFVGGGRAVADSVALQLRLSVPIAEVSSEPAEDGGDRLGFASGARDTRVHKLALRLQAPVWCCRDCS